MQVVIEDDRFTDRQLTRALTVLGTETTVNAKQVHRPRPLAARRTQDDRVRGLGDLIRTYSQSVAEPDQMAAAMIGLPSPVLAEKDWEWRVATAQPQLQLQPLTCFKPFLVNSALFLCHCLCLGVSSSNLLS